MKGAVLAGLLWCTAAAWAADLAGSEDLAQLTRFPQAQIIAFEQEVVTERLYPKGSLRRIGGRLRMDAQVTASGQLTALTYRLPDFHGGIEAFTQSRLELLAQGAELLYWCEGRACGSSSLWANAIFERSHLYGPEGQQAYLLARLPEAQDSLVAIYAITRGNDRAYLQAERLVPDAPLGDILPTAATLLRQLRETGELRLSRLPDAPPAQWSALLARVLQQDSTLRASLDGRAAEAWRDALVAQGVRPERLELDGSADTGLRLQLLR